MSDASSLIGKNLLAALQKVEQDSSRMELLLNCTQQWVNGEIDDFSYSDALDGIATV